MQLKSHPLEYTFGGRMLATDVKRRRIEVDEGPTLDAEDE